MKITLFVLAAFICVQIATAASKSKGIAEKAAEVSVEASKEAKASVEASKEAKASVEASKEAKASVEASKEAKASVEASKEAKASVEASKEAKASVEASKEAKASVEASKEAKASVEASASVEKSKELSGSLKKKDKSDVEKSGSLSVEKNKSEEAPVNLGWKEILEQITAILECLKEGKDLKSALKLKDGEKISILEELKEKIALALESIEEGKGIGDLSKVSEDIEIVKEIQKMLVLIAQLVQKGKDVSGLLDVEATVKIISELKASIEKLLSASANLAAKESKKLEEGLLGLLKSKGLLDLNLIKSLAPIIAELQKKGIELGALDLKNIGAIDIQCLPKTIEKVSTALKEGVDIQSILAGAEKFGISVSELKVLEGVLGLVGKLEGALSLKSLNLQGGASIIKKILPLPLL